MNKIIYNKSCQSNVNHLYFYSFVPLTKGRKPTSQLVSNEQPSTIILYNINVKSKDSEAKSEDDKKQGDLNNSELDFSSVWFCNFL